MVAVMPELRVRFPAPLRINIFSVVLLKVRLPAVTLLFTVVFPAAEKVALSPALQDVPVVPLYQVVPPVQLPVPPAVELPAELHVRLAASTVQGKIEAKANTRHARRSGFAEKTAKKQFFGESFDFMVLGKVSLLKFSAEILVTIVKYSPFFGRRVRTGKPFARIG